MERTFDGWPAEGPALLADIAADNRADRWPELRERHAAAVRGPTLALAAELAAEFGQVRVFRPHVSRRFRPDAPPLRTDTGGVATSPGGCVLAVVLSPSALTVTAGYWRFDRGQMHRYRAAVACADNVEPVAAPAVLAGPVDASQGPGVLRGDNALCEVGADEGGRADAAPGGGAGSTDAGVGLGVAGVGRADVGVCVDGVGRGAMGVTVGAEGVGVSGADPGEELAEVLARLAAEGLALDPEGELRGTPRGWRASHPRIALARRRGLQVVRRWELGGWISTQEPLERVRAAWRAAAPLVTWLDAHVGAGDTARSSQDPGVPPPDREPS